MSERHYLVVSDLHLSDVEDHPNGWKRHKSSSWVYDDELDRMVAGFEARLEPDDALTVVLNGDIFDFDLVTAVPSDQRFEVRPVERRYGLDATAAKSAWKLEQILADHPGFLATLGRLIGAGHDVIITIGNHDRELWFPEVEAVLLREVALASGVTPQRGRLVIEPWFFYVPGEVYVEHGHQYDFYSSFRYNLEPIVMRRGEAHIALSTGNLSNRYMLSNIGYFNPHATDFILGPFGYIRHWLRHYAFTRRMLILTWLVGSLRALFTLFATRARLKRHPPTDYARHLRAAAERYHLDVATVEELYSLRKEPITARFHKIVREFWLDRVVLALAMTAGTVALALSDAALWVKLVVPLVMFPLVWFVYQWAVGGENALTVEHRTHVSALDIARILPVRAVVFGHTHAPAITPLAHGVSLANSGTWAPIWDAELLPLSGLRNYVHVRIAPQGGVGEHARATECCVAVGSWIQLPHASPDASV